MSAPSRPSSTKCTRPTARCARLIAITQRWLAEQDSAWLRRKAGEAESFFRRTGITFNVYGDDDAEERLIPFDMVPRIIIGQRMAAAVARDRAAGARAQRLHARSLPPAGDHPLGPPARAAVPRQQRLAAADGRLHPAGRGLYPYRRDRPGPHRARRVPRARGQRPHAVGRQLHAREPRDDDGDVPRAVQPGEGAAGLGLSAPARQEPRRLRARRRARTSRRSRC